MKKYYICEEEEKFEELDKERQDILLEWIKENFIKTKTTNCKCGTSYRLKHIIQKQYKYNWKYYFTNEQFKKAMLLCGFKPSNVSSRNWYFNISQKSPALLFVKEIGGI